LQVLPLTVWDRRLDAESTNKGAQLMEKLQSGFYLGEICRLVFVFLVEQGALPRLPGLRKQQGFDTMYVSQIIADTSEGRLPPPVFDSQ
jgi:hexokinase